MFDAYHGDDMPLGGYVAIMGAYAVGFGSALLGLERAGRLPARLDARDVLLLGVATHKLTRTITKDWVTAPVRAPFTEYQGPGIAGEVRERARGRGSRRALGQLLTCAYCTGPWVSGALVCGLAAAPRLTRAVAATFAAVTVSDFLHRAYEAAAARAESIQTGAQEPTPAEERAEDSAGAGAGGARPRSHRGVPWEIPAAPR